MSDTLLFFSKILFDKIQLVSNFLSHSIHNLIKSFFVVGNGPSSVPFLGITYPSTVEESIYWIRFSLMLTNPSYVSSLPTFSFVSDVLVLSFFELSFCFMQYFHRLLVFSYLFLSSASFIRHFLSFNPPNTDFPTLTSPFLKHSPAETFFVSMIRSWNLLPLFYLLLILSRATNISSYWIIVTITEVHNPVFKLILPESLHPLIDEIRLSVNKSFKMSLTSEDGDTII